MLRLSALDKGNSLPENVAHTETAHGRQTPRPSGIFVVGCPHLDDDEGKNGGVLHKQTNKQLESETNFKTSSLKPAGSAALNDERALRLLKFLFTICFEREITAAKTENSLLSRNS